MVLQPFELVVGDEFDALEVLRLPVRAPRYDHHLDRLVGGMDRVAFAWREAILLVGDPHGVFQGPVVQVAGAAELRIVGIALLVEARIEQVQIGVHHRHGVELEGLLRLIGL